MEIVLQFKKNVKNKARKAGVDILIHTNFKDNKRKLPLDFRKNITNQNSSNKN